MMTIILYQRKISIPCYFSLSLSTSRFVSVMLLAIKFIIHLIFSTYKLWFILWCDVLKQNWLQIYTVYIIVYRKKTKTCVYISLSLILVWYNIICSREKERIRDSNSYYYSWVELVLVFFLFCSVRYS